MTDIVGTKEYEFNLAITQKILAALPTSGDVVGLFEWAFASGMPKSCGEPMLFLCMGLLRANAQNVSALEIRSHIAILIDAMVTKTDTLTSHFMSDGNPGTDALAFADFAITFIIERGAPPALASTFVDRFLTLASSPVLSS